MGFGLHIAPGVRISGGSHGVRAHVGPRKARVHVGSGRTSVSPGLGPLRLFGTAPGRSSTHRRSSSSSRSALTGDTGTTGPVSAKQQGSASVGLWITERPRRRNRRHASDMTRVHTALHLRETLSGEGLTAGHGFVVDGSTGFTFGPKYPEKREEFRPRDNEYGEPYDEPMAVVIAAREATAIAVEMIANAGATDLPDF